MIYKQLKWKLFPSIVVIQLLNRVCVFAYSLNKLKVDGQGDLNKIDFHCAEYLL